MENRIIDKIPKVFISYSRTSKEYNQNIKEIAERLRHDGIDVVFDEWDLKSGHNKYAFMEKCVNDPKIDRVLMFCDKVYAEKANGNKGGVGDETAIIRPELYGKSEQVKFIPVVMERDDSGDPFLPSFLKSIMYIDLTGLNSEEEYRKLVRLIYDEPLSRKPELGKKPLWLNQESKDLYPLKASLKKSSISGMVYTKQESFNSFVDNYIESLKKFHKKRYEDNMEYLDDFKAMKDYRDVFLDGLVNISEDEFGALMASVFERMYNTLVNTRSYDPHCISYMQCEFDIYKLHIWELFVCTTAYMLHNGMYKAIHDLLYHTYFLNSDPMGTQLLEKSYTALRFWSEMLEEIIKPKLSGDLPRKYTLTGHLICTEREYFPIFTADAIANADLFLYQVYNGMDLECFQYDYAWFPGMYIYAKQSSSIWKRVKSRRFCIEIAKLFGVETIKELKDRLSKCVHDSDIRYNLGGPSAPAIMDIIDIGEIGVLP